MDMLFTVIAFVVALGILISVHEFGHFWVARRLGIKVLRFSIGFGRPLLTWQRSPDDTEYVLAALPLGGYVRMLDETEDEVPERELHRAFNRQPLWKRVAVVSAGPFSNLLFAVLVYWALFLGGDVGLRPLIGEVEPTSVAAEAGFVSGDELVRVGDRPVRSWEEALFALTAEALDGEPITIGVRDADQVSHERVLPGEALAGIAESPDLVERLGLAPQRPALPPVVGRLVPGEPAEQAGLAVGDRILAADGTAVTRWRDWVALVRERPRQPITLEVERGAGERVTLEIVPRALVEGEHTVGRIGAGVDVPDDLMADYRVEIHHDPLEALVRAGDKTLDTSLMIFKVIGRMLVGQASVENLSGPIAIAETAGRTASHGLESFAKFLAMLSISLGVLNLLPIPLLDGGHLVYYLIEGVKGSPLSETALANAQRVGLVLIVGLMVLAFYVDLSRLLG
ncbi:peptidase [Marichromatium purpuratum 984]|uniref:Zinc metalloprotease n=1 Tax=Marichromatium purpuratum 984 TaxID=765910 RepID=W0E1C1_MARPU|nr:RIP metalloprotease RseP [Marichromatium purpuratum]AHF03308.1 peptidase [Marichromatium purpuratum 984]